MRFSRCLIKLADISEEKKEGKVILPKGIFDGIEHEQLFIATRRKDTKHIILHPIKNKDAIIYEVYCELCVDKVLHLFIMNLKKVSIELDITLLNITDGICKGDPEAPCTFDGFVMLNTETEGKIPDLKEKIKNIEVKGDKIAKTVELYKV